MDDLTRISAALALGVIGRDTPELWPPRGEGIAGVSDAEDGCGESEDGAEEGGELNNGEASNGQNYSHVPYSKSSNPPVHRPLPVFARKALLRCLRASESDPVRRACAEALGVAQIPEAEEPLRALIESAGEDPALRVFAGRDPEKGSSVMRV